MGRSARIRTQRRRRARRSGVEAERLASAARRRAESTIRRDSWQPKPDTTRIATTADKTTWRTLMSSFRRPS